MKKSYTICLLIALVLLVRCGQVAPTTTQPSPTSSAPTSAPTSVTQPSPTTASASPTIATTATTAAPSPSSISVSPTSDQAQEILVVFHKMGGIAGLDELLTVYDDGRLELREGGTVKNARIPAADLSRLRELLNSQAFAALEPRYEAEGSDLFTYEVTVWKDGQKRTIISMDTAQHPRVFDQVRAELDALIDRARQ